MKGKKSTRMKNILSYKLGTSFSGKEIKDWIRYNIENNTSRAKIAYKMKGYLETLEDDVMYVLYKDNYSSCASYEDYFVKRIS